MPAHLQVASVVAAEESGIWTRRETPRRPPFSSLTSWPLSHPLVAWESWGPEGHPLSATLLSPPFPGQASALYREHISSITPPLHPDINALNPAEAHVLAKQSPSDDGLAMTHTLVVACVYHEYSIPAGFPFPRDT